MKLDNEQQRALLLQVIAAVPISGTYPQVRDIVVQLDALIKDVETAEIETT